MSTIGSIMASSGVLITDRLQDINKQLGDLPSVLDRQTLQELIDGEYDITLQEYTDMNTYKTTMSALYGNQSADRFPSMLNNIVGNNSNRNISAKEFIDIMRERGLTSTSAMGLYTALRTYSITSSLIGRNSSYLSAKI